MPLRIGLILFPRLTQLDLTGPLEVFSRVTGASVDLLWKTKEPVRADCGISLLPTKTFSKCDALDVICVPGGPGQVTLMDDEDVLAFLRRIAPGCQLVTSVCTGSLVLAAAGLLTGYKATCHWTSLDQLALFGVTPVGERVVRDRNRITGAGVTSGIDFALQVEAELAGEDEAKRIMLQIEYDPKPPFAGGSPKSARPELVEAIRRRIAPFLALRREASEMAAKALERNEDS